MDEIDRRILSALQEDASQPVAQVAARAGISPSPCWRRIRMLEEKGYIRRRVAILDPAMMNVGLTVFIGVRTRQHSIAWLERFHNALDDIPEVVEFHRMSGDIDYLLRVVVPDIPAYDAVYKRLIAAIELDDVTSMIAMETIKSTTALPVSYAT